MSANDRQIGGTFYKQEGRVEHWDIVWQWRLDYFQGQITKYVMRHREKGGIQDLKKAHHFLEKYMELLAGVPWLAQPPDQAVEAAPKAQGAVQRRGRRGSKG